MQHGKGWGMASAAWLPAGRRLEAVFFPITAVSACFGEEKVPPPSHPPRLVIASSCPRVRHGAVEGQFGTFSLMNQREPRCGCR